MEAPGRVPEILASLADPSRYRVLSLLADGEYCVSELATRLGLSQSCTTRHLQTLQRAGVLTRTRAGKRVLFRIREDDPELARVLELLVLRQPLETPPGPARTLTPLTHRPRQEFGVALLDQKPATLPTGGDSGDAVTMSATTSLDVVSDTPMATDSPADAGHMEAAAELVPSGAAVELEDFLL